MDEKEANRIRHQVAAEVKRVDRLVDREEITQLRAEIARLTAENETALAEARASEARSVELAGDNKHLTAERDALRARIEIMTDRQAASMISMIIEDEIGGEVCTKEWSQAAADRIVCALSNAHEQRTSVGDCLQTRDQMLSGLERGGISDE
jgi:hypothetical protein